MVTGVQLFENFDCGLLSLRSTDTWRSDKPVYLKSLASRISLFLSELFYGGRTANDQKAFDSFYAYAKTKIADLTLAIRQNAPTTETFQQIETALKIAAKIEISAWGKSCASAKNQNYFAFHASIEQLAEEASAKVDGWSNEDTANRTQTARWIHSTDRQRRFAALHDLNAVPYKFSEIPRGAVMLTDPIWYIDSTLLKKNGSIFKTMTMHLKAFLCLIATGMRYTHAELSLGKGESFDLDKKKGSLISGEMKIQSRGDKTFYGAVLAPDEEKILQAHRASYISRGLEPYETFDALFDAVEQEAKTSAPVMKATIADIAGVSIISPRPADYNPMDQWKPGEKRYACSATVCALFSKFGVDIGNQYSKKVENVSPADFRTSEFFKPLYV